MYETKPSPHHRSTWVRQKIYSHQHEHTPRSRLNTPLLFALFVRNRTRMDGSETAFGNLFLFNGCTGVFVFSDMKHSIVLDWLSHVTRHLSLYYCHDKEFHLIAICYYERVTPLTPLAPPRAYAHLCRRVDGYCRVFYFPRGVSRLVEGS